MAFKLIEPELSAKIKVIGVGGGGCNAINNMITAGLHGVEFVVANTDSQALEMSRADTRLQIGRNLTKGLGAGARPDVGREAAEESSDEIRLATEGSDMVFVTAGMGGGTGTGAAPVIAEISKEIGALTVAVVTRPFSYEGKKRARHADEGIEKLMKVVDTIITIPNDRLRAIGEPGTPIIELFRKVDDVLYSAVRGISDLIMRQGYINVDFADVKTVMEEMGPALMGTGAASGQKRAEEAVKLAIDNPLLEDISIDGARGILINITGHSEKLSIEEFELVSGMIHEKAHEDANIVIGQAFDDSLGDEIRLTVIATGIGSSSPAEQATVIASLEEAKVRRRLVAAGLRDEIILEDTKGMHNVMEDDDSIGLCDDPTLEIPTFLRRNAD